MEATFWQGEVIKAMSEKQSQYYISQYYYTIVSLIN